VSPTEKLGRVERKARDALADLGFVEANHCAACPRGQARWVRAGIHILACALWELKELRDALTTEKEPADDP
jgi:hypothetical protein